MTQTPVETGATARRIRGIEADLRRIASLHGVYAAGLVLIGLFLPLVRLDFNIETTVSYTPLDLVFLTATYEVDHPVVLVIVSVFLVATAVTAGAAFLVAAARQIRAAATVAMLASATLIFAVLVANTALHFVDALVSASEATGENLAEPQAWGIAAWPLLIGGLAGTWIGYVLRNQLEL